MKRAMRRVCDAVVCFFKPRGCFAAFAKTRSTRKEPMQRYDVLDTLDGRLEKLSLYDTTASKNAPRSLPTLPVEILDTIFRHLDSPSALALSATCTTLLPFAPHAYYELRFALGRPEHPRTLARTVEALRLLLATLRARPSYAATVRAFVLCDAAPASYRALDAARVPWDAWNLLAEQLDNAVAEILAVAPMLRRFVWSGYAVMQYVNAEATVQQLKRMRYLHNVAIYRVWGVNPEAGWVPSVPGESIRVERLSLDCFDSSPWWTLPFLRSNNRLRSLDLRYVGDHRDGEWTRELRLAAISWRNLQTLNVTCTEDGAATMLGLLRHAAACESWPSLTSISFDPLASSTHSLMLDFMTTLRAFPIRRLHLTVCNAGTYVAGFGPALVGNIFSYLPNLEELALDHSRTSTLAPLPGTLEEWSTALRKAPHLRALTLPTLFITDGTDTDTFMDPSDSASYLPGSSTLDRLPVWLQRVYHPLSIWAEDLADGHLRARGFCEVRFVHDLMPSDGWYRECRVVRFGQVCGVEEGEERFMMRFLGVGGEGGEEDGMVFWVPRVLRRSQW